MPSRSDVQHGVPKAKSAFPGRRLSKREDGSPAARGAFAGRRWGSLSPVLFFTGLAASLQRAMAGKEQKIQRLKEDVEKLKKENREKDDRLAVVSAKVNSPRDGLTSVPSRTRVGVGDRDEEGDACRCVKEQSSYVCGALCRGGCNPRVRAACK